MSTSLLVISIFMVVAGLWWVTTRNSPKKPGEPWKKMEPKQPTNNSPPAANPQGAAQQSLKEHARLVTKLKKAHPTQDIAWDTSAGKRTRSDLNPSGLYNLPVTWRIDYVDGFGSGTLRTIRVEHLSLRDMQVVAYCEKRHAYRTFNLSAIKKAVDPQSGVEVDIDSYVRHVRAKRARSR